ncbi:MAG TPA: TolC family protein [Terriglobia bacterium]|nr:TolC family protein [Terriglobia bacterium]
MTRGRLLLGAFLLALWAGISASAQTFPTPEYFGQLRSRPVVPSSVPGPQGLKDYLVDGKLRLTLDDAIRLTLMNSTDVHLNELPVESAKFSLERSFAPFDPAATSSFTTSRSASPSFTQLAGAPTLSSLSQQSQFGYSQTLETGTNYQVGFSASKSSTNSVFNFFNPSLFTSLNLSFTQPLLRDRGFFPNRAPIVIAQRNLAESRATFQTSVNDTIQQVVIQYWNTVQAREGLAVQHKALDLAEATYKQQKRALELGAIPPLDIYRSESEVATRRVAVIQSEYALKQAEDQLRRTIGADLDNYFRALDLELTEKPEPSGELVSLDEATALQRAMTRRPEFEALHESLANDETSIRLAHNGLLPDLRLNGFYSSSGLGGNQFDITTTPPALISRGGFGDALGQVFGFGFPTYGFTMTLNLPIKNRAAQADLGNALVTRRRGLYLERQLHQAVTLEVANVIHQLEEAKLALAAAGIARDLAQKTLEADQRKYDLGTETIFFVLDAQNALAQAELNYLQAEVTYDLAITAVDHATGELLERHKIQIAQATQ